MALKRETSKCERLWQSKQFSCPDYSSECAFQTTYEVSRGGTHHPKKVISERYIEEERSMSSSPTPTKHARVELSTTGISHEKKDVDTTRMGCAEFSMDTSTDALHIKTEPPDDVEKEQSKNFASFHDTVSRARSNSLHSTTISSSRKSRMDSAKLHSASCATASANQGREVSRPFCVTPDRPSTSLGTVTAGDTRSDQPDSSTETCEQLMQGSGSRNNVSNLKGISDHAAAHQASTTSTCNEEAVLCQVCGDLAAGFYCDAYICEACKKFFIRASKLERPRYVCLRQKNCVVTKESRVHCQYCRYQKCLQLNMHYSKDGHKSTNKVGVQEIPCRVCSAPSSGFHFGALTCEGCKGFFRRMVKEREAYSYKCSRNGKCDVNAMTRNMCKACRYNKCLQIGMSVEGSRIGRQPNAIKHAISLEAKKQAALKTEPENGNGGNSSPSNFSFDSIILDPCLPSDVDDSLQSVDMNQDSVSMDHLASPTIKTEDTRFRQEPLAPDGQDSCTSVGAGQHISSPTPQLHSDVFRIPHQTLPLSSDTHRLIQDQYSANPSSSSESFSIPQNTNLDTFGRSLSETHISSMENQPQDLSMDLSMHRSNNSGSSHNTSQCKQQSSKSHNMSSSQEGPHTLSSPLSNSPSSPSYSSADYMHQTQQTFQHSYFHSSSVDQEEHHLPVYQHGGSYRSNSPVFNIESYSHYDDHNIAQYNRHMQQNEVFTNRLNSAVSQPLDHFTSPSPDYNREHGIVQEQQAYNFHQHGPDLLEQSQPLTRQTIRDDLCPHPTDQQQYDSYIDKNEVYNEFCHRHGIPDQSCQMYGSPQMHNFKLSPQQWSQCPPYSLPQSPTYATSHFQPPSPAVTPAPCPQKSMRQSPSLTPNYDVLEAPSPAPIPEKIAASRDHNYMYMSNKELHVVILDAAKNLAHFSVVHRAKSDGFDENRFKDVDSTWEKMMEHFNFHAKCIVRFAKRVPGFRRLKIDDQVVLLRMATYSLVILNHSRAFELETGFYNYFNFTKKEIRRIQELFPEFDVIHSHYKHIGVLAQRLSLTEEEYAYMSCVLLLNDEYPGLDDTERTKELKERYLEAFQDYELEHFSNGSLRFGQMLLRLSEFSQINMEHNIAVGLVITKNSQLHIPQLYAEMYGDNTNSPG